MICLTRTGGDVVWVSPRHIVDVWHDGGVTHVATTTCTGEHNSPWQVEESPSRVAGKMAGYMNGEDRRILAMAEIEAASIEKEGMVARNASARVYTDKEFFELADLVRSRVRELIRDPREDSPDGTPASTGLG